MIFTVGHSTRSIEAFIGLLRAAGADLVADVRRFPGSRRHPQFNAEALERSLAAAGIGYRHFPALGGRRGEAPGPSEHTLWREAAFRNYADYAETEDFRAAFRALRHLETEHHPAVMCAEAVWWRCHRRIIADYLIAAGVEVRHILDGKIEKATLTPGARPQPEGSILYAEPRLI
ncbi:MAG TPA: DUF488 domain-containing protein [Stellaceae bacterium]|nr:DUF488 domain-containing protein [Stellaceae bacterium]